MRDLATAMRDLHSAKRVMPCEVEFVTVPPAQSSIESSSCSDSIDLLMEGIESSTKSHVEDEYLRQECPYTCGKTFLIHKQSKHETLGIELGKVSKYGGVYVTKIEPTSKFAYTGLKPGMQILSVNDHPCPVDFRMVACRYEGYCGRSQIICY